MANPFKQDNQQNSAINSDIMTLQNMHSPQEAMAFLNKKSPQEQWNILCELCYQRGINPNMFFGGNKR